MGKAPPASPLLPDFWYSTLWHEKSSLYLSMKIPRKNLSRAISFFFEMTSIENSENDESSEMISFSSKKLKMLVVVQQIWNNLCLSVERDLFSGWKLQGIWIPPGLYTIWVFPIIFIRITFLENSIMADINRLLSTRSLACSRQQ